MSDLTTYEGVLMTPVDGPTIREHADLKERVTRLEASLGHLPAEVQRLSRSQEQNVAALHELTRLVEAIRTDLQQARQPSSSGHEALTQAALAIHRAVEQMGARQGPSLPMIPSGGPLSAAQLFVYIGVAVAGGFAMPILKTLGFLGG